MVGEVDTNEMVSDLCTRWCMRKKPDVKCLKPGE